jgi:K+-sensing histidine kinase KdpD
MVGMFPSRSRFSTGLNIAVGVALCAAASALLAEIFASRSSRNTIPLVFIAVIVLLAARYGSAVGVFGSIAAALIFSILLFPPLYQIRVQDAAARENIGWMLLAGIALSYLLAGPPQKPNSRER